jgi:hypothetical protein
VIEPLKTGTDITIAGKVLRRAEIRRVRISESARSSTSKDAMEEFDSTRGRFGSYVYGVGHEPFAVWFANSAPDVTDRYIDQESLRLRINLPAQSRDEQQPSRPLRVFLCHAFADKPQVRVLFKRLQADGFEPWLDETKLLPGYQWKHEIIKALSDSDAVLVCLTRQSVSKTGFVQREISAAIDLAEERPEGTVYLIPVRLEHCDVPLRLQRWQWVDFFETEGYEVLRKSLKALEQE